MTSAARRPMAGAEALLWTIDRDPVLRSTIVAVLVLDRAPAQPDVRRLFLDLATVVPRMEQRGIRPLFGLAAPQWSPTGPFDPEQHIRRVAAPAPGTLETVLQLAQAMAGTAFDPALPPWEAVVVEGLEGGQGALVLKVHHAVVDGVGGLSALLSVTGAAGSVPDTPAASSGAPLARIARTLTAALSHPADAARALAHDLVTVGQLLAPAPTPRSPLARRRGIVRRFGVLDLSLPELRRVAHATGVTINDVFVAGVLGGLERYHELHGAPVPTLRGLIPVSIRRRGDPVASNRFVPVRFLLPAAMADPLSRVRRVHEVLGAPVHDPALRVSDALATGLSRFPAPVSTAVFGSMLKGNDFVATNVPGPRTVVELAGVQLERIYAFSPPTGAGCNVSLVSLGRRACLGVNVDTVAIPDHSLLLECLRMAFAELTRLAPPTRGAHPARHRAERPGRPAEGGTDGPSGATTDGAAGDARKEPE